MHHLAHHLCGFRHHPKPGNGVSVQNKEICFYNLITNYILEKAYYYPYGLFAGIIFVCDDIWKTRVFGVCKLGGVSYQSFWLRTNF